MGRIFSGGHPCAGAAVALLLVALGSSARAGIGVTPPTTTGPATPPSAEPGPATVVTVPSGLAPAGLGGRPRLHYALPPGPPPLVDPLAPLDPTLGPRQLPAAGRDRVACGLPVGAVTTVGPYVPPSGALVGEISGLVASVAHPGVAWAIRDSGHPASLWLIRFDAHGRAGATEFPVPGAANRDWEDLVYTTDADGRGHLYTFDSGQSGGPTTVYEILEPDPATDHEATLLHRFPYAYPDGGRNTESAFLFDGRLVLVQKTAPAARMYRFDTLAEGTLNQPVFVGDLPGTRNPSIVRVSPDGRMLVAATHTTVTVYCDSGAPGLAAFAGRAPDATVVDFPGDNVEGGDFYPAGASTLVFVSESRHVLQLPAFVGRGRGNPLPQPGPVRPGPAGS